MQLFRFIPIKLTLFLILGILLGSILDVDSIFPLVLALLFLVILALLFKWQKNGTSIVFGTVVALTTLCLGILAISLSDQKNLPHHYSNPGFGSDIHRVGIWQLKIAEVLKPTPFSTRYIATVSAFDNKMATGRLLLNFSLDSTARRLNIDDELVIHAPIDSISPPLNPHQFSYRNYMASLGIDHQMRLGSDQYFVKAIPSKTLYGMAASIRNKIILKLEAQNFGSAQLGIIKALLLGQRNDISPETYDDYKNAGAVHILAVSGLHIGVLLLLLEFLLRPLESLPKGKTIKLIVVVLLLWSFALLAGLSASVVRAVTMFSFVAYALYLNRPSNTFNILALSMFFILLVFDPKLLFHVGFQMSYAAVFAIVWIYPLLQKFWFPKNIVTRKVWQLLSVSIAAQLGVLPISLFYFHQFPGLFFVSNLLVVPFLGLILGLGILVIVLASFDLLPAFLVWTYNTLIGWMNTIIGWVAQQEAFIFKNISFDGIQLVLTYAIIVSLVMVFAKATFRRTAILLTAIIGFQLWSFYVSHQAGQKEALLIAHQTRNSVLLYQKGNDLAVMTHDAAPTERMAADYIIAERIASVRYRPIRNSYTLKDKKLLILDSLGIYPPKIVQPDYVLLTQSPKINLERMIDSLEPKAIIADGSNYRNTVERWRRTCLKKGLPFHYTGEKGAYYFEHGD